MGDILFLAHRIPFPPDRGDKIRSHHLLRGLAKLGPVHVGTFAESAADLAQEGALADLAESHFLPMRNKPLRLAGVEALLTGKPVSLTAFGDRVMHRWVRETISASDIETIFVFSGQMGQYVPDDFAGRVVVDLCDVDSAKFEGYADGGERVWLNRRESKLLAREEARLASRAETTLLISDNEAALFESRLPAGCISNVRVLGNGVDAGHFAPDAVEPHPEIAGRPGPHFVFTGQMDYTPNERSALWVTGALMPIVREVWPTATFHVVGRAPTPLLVRTGEREDSTIVWGEVPDTRPFIAAADVVLAPLTIARGVQNKVLEAMAMGRPVMLTQEAATGIDARDGEHFCIEWTEPEAMTRRLERLLGDASAMQAMGEAARRFVVDTMSWEAVHDRLAHIVEGSSHVG